MDNDMEMKMRVEAEDEHGFVQEEEKLRYGGVQNESDDEDEEEEEEDEEEQEEEEVDEEVEEQEETVPEPPKKVTPVVEEDNEEARKVAERERKKAEVRRRLEEAGRMKKAKKGFLTPERKKKLRKLLMLKAAEDLKEKQKQLEIERQRTLAARIVPLPDLENGDLKEIFEEMKQRVIQLELDCYDVNYCVRQKDFEINELTIAVNDLRGKFVRPTLKKVSKTEGKFSKLKKKSEARVDFRSGLKTVEKNPLAGLEEDDEPKKRKWAK